MARSTYIYIVESNRGVPLAAFTVKHECAHWIRSEDLMRRYLVSIWYDGRGKFCRQVTVEDFLNERNT